MADHDHATSSSHFKHDVFLSFRGNTRHAFTDHLFDALIRNGINTFRDDRGVGFGNEIRPTLLEAIEKSRMSIVVLCGNYASSTWCLDELVKIMECKDKGRPVIPVFYHVEPREVRYQQNQYETAMIEHENKYGRDSPRLAAWRSALVAVSNLSGESCNKR